MTIQKYTQFTNDELLNIIQCIDVDCGHLNRYLSNHSPDLLNEIVDRTKFLDEGISLNARLFCISNNITEHPKCQCPGCSNKVLWHKPSKSFLRYCSKSCAYNDEKHWKRVKAGCILNLGVDNPGKSITVQEKMRRTCIERYGVEHAIGSEEVQNKIKEIFLTRYNVEYPLQSEEVRKSIVTTCINKYGVEYPMQSKDFLSGMIEVVKDRYGVDWYSQSGDYHRTRKHKFTNPKFPGVSFDSTWELKVYDFLMENHIEFTYQPDISIPYEYEGTLHTYHPDFLVNGKLYEVKGDHFFRMNESTGKEEMFLPYRNPEWSSDEYAYRCGLYEEKHQCMISNNVIILRESLVKFLDISMFNPLDNQCKI